MLSRFIRGLATATATATHQPRLQDIVIIGGGPAGLSLLAALKASPITRDLSCTLVEANSLQPVRDFATDPPTEYTNRVVSLTPKSLAFMHDKIGSWEYMNQNRVKFYNNIIAYDGQDSSSRVEFDSKDINEDFLAVMVENINIQSSLLQQIEDLSDEPCIIENAKVLDIENPTHAAIHAEGHTHSHEAAFNFEPDYSKDIDWPIVKLSNGESIQARLLVGADGYNSPVRKYAHIASRGWMYNRFGVVATVKIIQDDLKDVAWQRFLTTGPLAILPLTGDNRTIVWSTTPELSELLLKCDSKIFPHLVNAACILDEVDLKYIYGMLKENPNDMSILQEIQWRLSRFKLQDLQENYPVPLVGVVEGSRARFPLKMSHADTYTCHRVALIGDAAHTVHPLAGQGLNMGQSDVASLMDAIEKAVQRGLDIGSTLALEPYTSNAWPANHALIGVCDKLHKLFSSDWEPLVMLRGFGMKSFNMLGSVKDLLMKTISGR